MKGVPRFPANKGDELIGIAELARVGHAGGQVATQGDNAADALRLEAGELAADALLRCANAG
jgi:hypothetical protein